MAIPLSSTKTRSSGRRALGVQRGELRERAVVLLLDERAQERCPGSVDPRRPAAGVRLRRDAAGRPNPLQPVRNRTGAHPEAGGEPSFAQLLLAPAGDEPLAQVHGIRAGHADPLLPIGEDWSRMPRAATAHTRLRTALAGNHASGPRCAIKTAKRVTARA